MTTSTIIESTGEVLEYPASTGEEVIESYRAVNEAIAAYEQLKKLLQQEAEKYIDSRGVFEHDGYALKQVSVQRMTYDKAVMREVFDEDTFDLMLEPSKTRIDNFLKEHLEDMGEDSTRLRAAMVPVGKPYSFIKLERLTR